MFTDAAGRRWGREKNGRLLELDHDTELNFEEEPAVYESPEDHRTLRLPKGVALTPPIGRHPHGMTGGL